MSINSNHIPRALRKRLGEKPNGFHLYSFSALLLFLYSVLSGAQASNYEEWDITTPRGDTQIIDFYTDVGAWMPVAATADDEEIVFDLLGHIYAASRISDHRRPHRLHRAGRGNASRRTAELVEKGGRIYDAQTLDQLWPDAEPFGARPWAFDEAWSGFRRDDQFEPHMDVIKETTPEQR